MTQGGHELHFYYDAQGKPSVVIYDGTAYGYLYNLQGDVVALVDGTGTKVVEYTYDAWGKPTGKTGTMASTLGTVQPFRYRGYVWDEETGLYYLRSRYYRPEWCRFLSADALIKGNVYAYCLSSPSNYYDPSGLEGITIIGYSDDGEEEISIDFDLAFPNSFKPEPIPGIELMSKKELSQNFIINKKYIAELTDLITGYTFTIDWIPKDKYHTDFWFAGYASKKTARECLRTRPKENWDDPQNWSRNARPGMLSVVDKFGHDRKIAVGFVLFPHHKNYSHFSQNGEMCMFYGDDTMGYARSHGNEAAINAYYGYYYEVLERKP